MERARFGIFDFSPSTGELRREGKVVRLQAQPAKVLALLVARAGEVVSRDTLKREIWSDGTHVDFERGLNFCIAQVRAALKDSADSPRYIETLPKQGYRFIAPVSRGVEERPQPQSESRSRRDGRRWVPAVFATVAALLAVVALVWARASDDRPTVVVVPFYNETGRSDLDPLARSLGDAVVASLAASDRRSGLSVIGNASALRNPFARTDVQQIARDLRGDVVVIGQLKADGSGLRLIAHLIRASDMKHLWAQPFDDAAFAFDAQTRAAEAIASAIQSTLASN
jgi:DNA-binding winged helix-turn-helix (wHTH) protein/TolB-like protein